MRNITIRRRPTCQHIGGRVNELASDLRSDPNNRVNLVDGNKGEFTIEADGRRINGKTGDMLRESSDIADEIRGAPAATAP